MAEKMNVHTEFTGSSAGFDKTIRDVNSGMGNMAKNAKNYAANFISLGVAIGATKKVIDLYIQGLKQSGEGADKLERFTTQLKAGFDSLAISIEKASFANLVANWERATKAAGEYADEMDLVNDRMQDLSVKRASVASGVQMLRTKQAEGTITKEESEELKRNTEDLLKIEQDIYDEAIKAQVEFIADKRGLNAELFKTLESGIDRRVGMNQEELKGLDQYVKDYTALEKKLIKENTKRGPDSPMGRGVYTVDMEEVNKQLSEYLQYMPEVARLQIFQQKLASQTDWNKLIGFYTKRNQLEGEYAGLIRRTVVAGNKADSSQFKADRPSVDGMSYINTNSFAQMPGIQAYTGYDEEYIKSWSELQITHMARVQESVKGLTDAFSRLGDTVVQSAQDGEVSFTDSMNIISAAAEAAMAVLGALAAANIIASEVESKGIYGVLTAIAGLATLAGVWGSYVTPEKYAKGGIAYGPTVAQIGEYAGASSNPEVVAPLSKLKGLLGGQNITVTVKGKLHGRDIYLSAQDYAMMLNENT